VALRKSALATMEVAYLFEGDGIWKLLGKLSDQQKSLIEERLKCARLQLLTRLALQWLALSRLVCMLWFKWGCRHVSISVHAAASASRAVPPRYEAGGPCSIPSFASPTLNSCPRFAVVSTMS
jgi:hypothetical protein